jgi:hypothetical protein
MELVGDTYIEGKVPVGTKIKFERENRWYTVRASNVAFVVCTKPFNLQKTVLYTIIDWRKQIRGPENLIFGMGPETDEDCEAMLKRLTEGDSEVSDRHQVSLDIEKVEFPDA